MSTLLRDKVLPSTALAMLVAILIIARWLQPSPMGLATHQQLGLPPCRFLLWTGLPCPSCGFTTSFAFAAHFSFAQAFWSSPFGLLLFFAVVLSVPAICLQLWKRASWRLRSLDGEKIAGWAVVLYVSSWIFKLLQATQ